MRHGGTIRAGNSRTPMPITTAVIRSAAKKAEVGTTVRVHHIAGSNSGSSPDQGNDGLEHVEVIGKSATASMTTIYKICDAAQWAEAGRDGEFRGAAVDRADGYIHFSTAAQVAGT